jgi:hypothetical protein
MTFTLLALAAMNAVPSLAHDASLAGTELHHRGWLVAQNDMPPPPPPPESAAPSANTLNPSSYDGWSTEQLRTESRRLHDLEPGLGGPIALLAVGAGLTLFVGAPLTFVGISYLAVYGGFELLALGLSFLLPGIALAVIGGVWLGSRIAERRGYSEKIEDIDNRLRRSGEGPGGVPSVEQYRPVPNTLVLARF